MATQNFIPIIPGYQICSQLYAGYRTKVYRGIREQDTLPVVIKLLASEYPSFNELLQFRNQYTISKNLQIPGIIHPLALEPYQNGYILVMADTGTIALREYIKTTNLSLIEFLTIAIQLTQILHDLHQNRVIHKDIKPANILIHPETKQVQLIDFIIASLLSKETQEIKNPNVLEGTLAYISPEQTGRMNRGIDYRSDFYSLGVTFYELLTGELPFISDDPMELLHCHLAKTPTGLVNQAEIPQVVADIVMKLMAKNAEDRYQNALGLKHDLEICISQVKETGTIIDFEIGKQDLCDRFLIPEKLYGREAEVVTLLQAFDRVANGTSEMMLVAGFSGIGKTAVVNEIHKPITRKKGYFIKGKFDQFNRNIPLSAFLQVFRDLMGQLLAESDSQLQTWKTKILATLGDNAQVIIEVIPELELIIGEQPPAPELSGTAAQNRFNLLFEKFIKVFTTAEHPLVIFLDDLQWADLASLKLIQLLIGESSTSYLLLIGAYRDNEVFAAHPLMLTLNEISKAGATVNTITLKSLSELSLNQLVADTLSCTLKLAEPLTKLIYQKTQGNPFFTTQFLKALHQEQLITFDAEARYWQCDITQVRDAALTDDVVKLMAQQLQKLSVETQAVLKLAACIGNQFNLSTLAIICEQSQIETATALWKALQDGLVLPNSQIYKFFQFESSQQSNTDVAVNLTYRFFHDRVQQAAYSLIPEEQKHYTHLRIGQLLLKGLSQAEKEEHIFDIVNQLNMGQAVITNTEQKQELANLNLQAGQKAKLSAAYQAAQDYCTVGIALLSLDAWYTNYELMYSLHRDASEAAYLCSNFDQAEALYAEAVTYAQTPLDKAIIYRVQMTQYQLQGRNAEAIAIQLQALQLLGLTMPTEPEIIQASLDAEIATVEQFLEQHTIESILAAPKMQDASIAEMLRILQILFYAAWLDGQSTLALLALAKMTTLSLQYGNSDMSPFGYVGYGLIANGLLKNCASAYQFGEMAVQLCEQFDNADVRGMTNFLFAADVHSWSHPIREADTYYNNAYKYGMEAGNWLTVSFMMMQSGSDRLTYGKNLDDLYAIAQNHAAFLAHIKSLDNLDALTAGVIQPIRHLLGLTKTPFTFDDDSFSEAEYLQKYQNAPYNLAWLYSVKIRHAYLFDQKPTYSDLISQLSIIENTIPSHAKVPSSVFYVALMHLALAETATEDSTRQHHWQAVSQLEERLNLWVKACPENILHKCLLIQAEKAKLNKDKTQAIELYEQAITQAQANEYGYEEGLANELAAKFYLDWGKQNVAAGYMQQAYYCYARWGAKAKTNDLEQRYPHLLGPILQPAASTLYSLDTLTTVNTPNVLISTSTTTSFSSSSSSINTALDFTAILKASQALSRTIQLDELLHQLTQIILQNSGGDRCALILPDSHGEWYLKAIATNQTTEICSQPLEGNPNLPLKLIQYVKNTQEVVSLDNLQTDLPVIGEYFTQQQPKSVLCLPILNQGNLIGILYLNNQSSSGVFTSDRIFILNFLCTQAAISLENARLYQQSQNYAQKLEQSLQILQTTQKQLLQDEQTLQKQALALLQLSQSKAINQGKLREAFHELTTVTAETLQTKRVSIWLFDEHQTKIHCVDLCQLSCQEHSQGFELNLADYPAYFSAVKSQPIIAADDAFTDTRTCELNNGYLDVLNISSILDAGIQVDGNMGGIICCEHVGEKRSWTAAEQNFISSVANLIALTFESNQRQQKAKELNQALLDLKQSQLQIVQNEKMASLGNLVAGVAHEVNNPIGFLNGSISNAKEYIEDLIGHLKLYQQHYSQPASPIQNNADKIDLEFLIEDLPKLLNSMTGATERITSISTSLRTFSRADSDYKVNANLHEGIDSTLLILKYRLKANEHRPAIIIEQEYGNIPPIKCFPGQLNQVFMNILANAIDMFDEMAQNSTFAELQAHPQQITIRTEAIANQVYIKICDNGKGMSEQVKQKIFDHLFTTKGVGKGTGLGLAIARQIVEEKHGGKIEVHSVLAQGTEFIISIPK